MRQRFILALLAAGSLGYAQGAHAQARPYADRATVPEEPTSDPFLQMEIRTVRAAEVPELRAVEAPPYPGAVVIQTIASAQRISGKKRWDSLPVIILFSTDPVSRVVAFYRESLGGWTHARYLSSDYFWMGMDDFDPLGQSGQTIPSVQVSRARASKLVPDAVTEIQVRYRPGGGLVLPGGGR